MGKPTFDSGIPRPQVSETRPKLISCGFKDCKRTVFLDSSLVFALEAKMPPAWNKYYPTTSIDSVDGANSRDPSYRIRTLEPSPKCRPLGFSPVHTTVDQSREVTQRPRRPQGHFDLKVRENYGFGTSSLFPRLPASTALLKST